MVSLGLEGRVRELTLAGVLAGAIAAFLALGSGPPPITRPPLKVVLLDASLSVARGFEDHGRSVLADLLDEARGAQAEGAELAVVRFARDVELLLAPSSPAVLVEQLTHPGSNPFAFDVPRGLDLESATAQALDLALGLVDQEGRGVGEVVLLGDGWSSGADARPGLTRLVSKGHGFRLRAPRGEPRVNFQLLRVEGPKRLPEGRDLELRVLLGVQGASRSDIGSSQLRLTIETAHGVEQSTVAVAHTGWTQQSSPAVGASLLKREVRVVLPALPTGPFRIEARIESAGDLIAEDDRGFLSGVVGDGPLALLVAPPGDEFDPLWVAGLESSGIHTQVTEPAQVSGALASAGILITLDLAPSQLEPLSLLAFLDAGGLWCVLGGQASMAGVTGQPPQDGLARHLPLIPAKDEGGPRDVVLVVDGSGSMVGLPWQRVQQAVFHLAKRLLASDGLVLRVFTTRLADPLLAVQPGGAKDWDQALSTLLDAHLPGGATDVAFALTQLVQARAAAQRRSLCVLISDGHSSQGPGPDSSMRSALQDVRADLAVIAVEGGGRLANRDGLGRLLRPGEQLLVAEDLEGLDTLLQEVVEEERIIGPLPVSLLATTLDSGAVLSEGSRGAQEAFLQRWRDRSSLSLERAWRAQLTPGASALVRAPSGEPLLASKEVRRGHVLVLASTPWESGDGARPDHPLLLDLLLTLAREKKPRLQALVQDAGGLRLMGDLSGLARPFSVHWTLAPPLGLQGEQRPQALLAKLLLAPSAGDPGGPLEVPWPGLIGQAGDSLLCAQVVDGKGEEVVQSWLLGPLPPDLGVPQWPRLASRLGQGAPLPSGPHPLTGAFLALALACWTLAGWVRSGT